jgi:GTP-binding protein HflX
MKDLAQEAERVILVAIHSSNESKAIAELEELVALAEADNLQVVGSLLQSKKNPDPAFYLGKGKVEELLELKKDKCASMIIFDNELRSSQVRNLSKKLDTRVIDRTELILDIFESRAKSKQAKLQVKVACLQYEMSRLRKLWTHFGRIDGSIGGRGMGETQLEVDRRRTRSRLYALEKELKTLVKKKAVERQGRSDIFKVALVGYTNAGKSTLLNQLSGSDVFVEDLLFATLDTTTRQVDLGKSHSIILSDTVGFVRKLPHHLIASFHATLSEVKEADLLLHVVDISSPNYKIHLETVQETLKSIGVGEKETILVFNKTDCLDPSQSLAEQLEEKYSEKAGLVFISAKAGFGIEELKKEIFSQMKREVVKETIAVPWANGKALAFLKAHAQIISENILEDKQLFEVKMKSQALAKLQHLLK